MPQHILQTIQGRAGSSGLTALPAQALKRPQGSSRSAATSFRQNFSIFDFNPFNQGPTLADQLQPLDSAFFGRGVDNAGAFRMLGGCAFSATLCNGGDPFTTLANASQLFSGGFGDQLQNLLSGGFSNQFTGQLDFPVTFTTTFQQPDFAGAFSTIQAVDPSILNVAGFNSSSPFNFTTQFLMGTNNFLMAPWTDPNLSLFNTGFSGFSTNAKTAVDTTPVFQRYSQLANQQMSIYYQNKDLSQLRVESNQVMIDQIYRDPLYLYYDYAVSTVLNEVQGMTPSYPQYVAVANELASYSAPPDDPDLLRQRYERRMQYTALALQVQYEAASIILNDASLLNFFNTVVPELNQRKEIDWSQPGVIDWYSDWIHRWDSTFNNAPEFAAYQQSLVQFGEDFPLVGEYLHINAQVSNSLLPQFVDHPEVLAVTQQVADTLADPDLQSQINQYYTGYQTTLQLLLNQTTYSAETEHFYEQVNGLLLNDPLYLNLTQVQGAVVDLAQNYEATVFQLVDQCYTQQGQFCNPYSEPSIVNYVTSQEVTDLVNSLALFYEANTLYWYLFYSGPAYQQVEQASRDRLLQSLSPIYNQVEQERSKFNESVKAIPAMASMHQTQRNLMAVLRGKSPSTLQIHTQAAYPYQQLDAAFAQLAALDAQLGVPTGSNTSSSLYMPFVMGIR